MLNVKIYDLYDNDPAKTFNEIKSEHTHNYPVVYIMYSLNDTSNPIYVGETADLKARLISHYKNENFRNKDDFIFQKIVIVSHEQFNKSATYNIETNLLNYLIADSENNKSFEIKNISQTVKSIMHNYYQKELFHNEISRKIWDDHLRSSKKFGEYKEIAKDKVDVLKNKELFKLSPFKELTQGQHEIKEEIIRTCANTIDDEEKHVFIVEGAAGTGKSVILTSLFNTLQELSRNKYFLEKNDVRERLRSRKNYFLVQNTDMHNSYKNIGKAISTLQINDFVKPTSFINKKVDADIVLIDEAHLLYSESNKWRKFYEDNAIKAIVEISKITILVFDERQVISSRKYWNKDELIKTLKNVSNKVKITEFKMEDQFRMLISPEQYNWIEEFLNGNLIKLPSNFKNNEDYELKIFDDQEKLKQAIFNKNKELGKSRIVATYDYYYDPKTTSIVDPLGLNMEWNSKYENSLKYWVGDKEADKQVGSIYSVQGFDLNYVGLFIGPSIGYDKITDKISVDVEKYKDKDVTNKFSLKNHHSNSEISEIQKNIIMNHLNILMKRGIKGLYIFAIDKDLREKLLSL